ncbi:hypothetical protein GFV14_00319 [Candidatus Hartigia pinicola]|nr:hypothetical protein GFV14_00319 [Candidatus Hartigia pinicola]
MFKTFYDLNDRCLCMMSLFGHVVIILLSAKIFLYSENFMLVITLEMYFYIDDIILLLVRLHKFINIFTLNGLYIYVVLYAEIFFYLTLWCLSQIYLYSEIFY